MKRFYFSFVQLYIIYMPSSLLTAGHLDQMKKKQTQQLVDGAAHGLSSPPLVLVLSQTSHVPSLLLDVLFSASDLLLELLTLETCS
jgi:anti-anti-sigma regulatory factor